MVLESKESEIYRVIKAGKALSEHQTSTAKSTTNSFPSATSTFLNIWTGFLNIFSLADSTTSLGSLFQFLATLPVKKFSPVSNLTPLARPKAVSRKHKSCLAFPSHVCSAACSWNSCCSLQLEFLLGEHWDSSQATEVVQNSACGPGLGSCPSHRMGFHLVIPLIPLLWGMDDPLGAPILCCWLWGNTKSCNYRLSLD